MKWWYYIIGIIIITTILLVVIYRHQKDMFRGFCYSGSNKYWPCNNVDLYQRYNCLNQSYYDYAIL